METQTERKQLPRCVMCGDSLVEYKELPNGQVVATLYEYKDKKTKEPLCRKCSQVNELIYRVRYG